MLRFDLKNASKNVFFWGKKTRSENFHSVKKKVLSRGKEEKFLFESAFSFLFCRKLGQNRSLIWILQTKQICLKTRIKAAIKRQICLKAELKGCFK